MFPTNNLLHTQPTLININLSNSDLEKLKTINKTMSANIESMNKRVDFLIFKLINLFIFLFQNKINNENKNKNNLYFHIYIFIYL